MTCPSATTQIMCRVLGLAKAGWSKSRWRDKANHSLDVFPEALAPKIHGRVLPHSEAARTGANLNESTDAGWR